MKKKLLVFLVIGIAFLTIITHNRATIPTSYAQTELWSVKSIDTMKTSRDMAREKLNDQSFTATIEKEVMLVSDLGANYIAIDTPYDTEFLPYLNRWVKAARAQNLHVWFRGSFSGYEGWFGYPKSISPDQLLQKTTDFITTHADLFVDGDIFDPCPECENGGYWPQPQKNNEYNQFMKEKNDVLKQAFEKINKNVIYNWNSVIGGRSKDILTLDTFNALGNVTALDHYTASPRNYGDYIKYFSGINDTKVVFSEFGAPIPDIHGKMTEQQQADFIHQVLDQLYANKDSVLGLNYWVLSKGTTALYNASYTPLAVADVLKNYYRPGVIRGNIKNDAGDNLSNFPITTADGLNSTTTNNNGDYQLVVPAGGFTIETKDANYQKQTVNMTIGRNEFVTEDFIVKPIKLTIFYSIKLNLHNSFVHLFPNRF